MRSERAECVHIGGANRCPPQTNTSFPLFAAPANGSAALYKHAAEEEEPHTAPPRTTRQRSKSVGCNER